MKKLTTFLSVLAILLFLSSCDSSCEHNYQIIYNDPATGCSPSIVSYECQKCHDVYSSYNYGHCDLIPQESKPHCGIYATSTKCESCGIEIYDNKTQSHNYEYTVLKEPTCYEPGINKGVCTLCGNETKEYIKPLGHLPVKRHEDTKPNCNYPGITYGNDCSRCGISLSEDLINAPATGHNYNSDGKCTNLIGLGYVQCGVYFGCYIKAYEDNLDITDYSSNTFYGINDIDKIKNLSIENIVNDEYLKDGKMYKEGYVFGGWFTEDGKSINQIDKDYITNAPRYIKFYAKWIPYEQTIKHISTPEDFLNIKNDLSFNYVLDNDIDFKGEVIKPFENFKGILDGRGHTVKNFILSSSSVNNNYGIFLKNEGTIKNIDFSEFVSNINLNTKVGSTIGTLIGINSGTIENVNISGNSSITYLITDSSPTLIYGNLIGKNTGSVTKCNSNCETKILLRTSGDNSDSNAKYILGGLVGINEGTIVSSSAKSPCTVESRLSGSTTGAIHIHHYANNNNTLGGLVGKNTNLIKDCYSTSDLNYNTTVTYNSKDKANIGGLVGENIKGKIETSYYTGNIVGGSMDGTNVGGLVGYNSDAASIANSYTIANITSASNIKEPSSTFACFVGKNNATIINSYAKGSVTSLINSNIAGFVGVNESGGTISKSFTTSAVTASSGKSNKFVASSSGILNKIYSLKTSLYNPGTSSTSSYEITELTFNELISSKVLVDELDWNEKDWYLASDTEPFLYFEFEYSHNYSEPIIYEPTCTEPGFTIYECEDCGKIFLCDIKPANGHSKEGEPLQITNPSHIENGSIIYNCSEGHTFTEIIAAVGHNIPETITCNDDNISFINNKYYYTCECNMEIEITKEILTHSSIDVPYLAPICETSTSGNKQGTKCELCNIILYGCEIIEPHEYELKETITPATCNTEGLGINICKLCENEIEVVLPSIPHTYVDRVLTCTVCNEDRYKIDETYYEISNYEELSILSLNPSGNYYLSNDIDLTNIDFKPLCDQNNPFTGVLLGNGHKISNISFNESDLIENELGFILYNYGVIAGLTIENVSISLNKTNTSISSILCTHNYGTLYMCEIKGNNNLSLYASYTSTSTEPTSVTFDYKFGGFAAINEDDGIINNCTFIGNFTRRYLVESILNSSYIANYLQKLLSVTKVENNTIITTGGISGINYGTIDNSTYSASIIHSDKIESKVAGINRGKSYLYLTLNDGAFVGINFGEINKCKSIEKKYSYHTNQEENYEYNSPIEIANVIIRLEYLMIKDNSVYEKLSGIIGYSNSNNIDIEIISE